MLTCANACTHDNTHTHTLSTGWPQHKSSWSRNKDSQAAFSHFHFIWNRLITCPTDKQNIIILLYFVKLTSTLSTVPNFYSNCHDHKDYNVMFWIVQFSFTKLQFILSSSYSFFRNLGYARPTRLGKHKFKWINNLVWARIDVDINNWRIPLFRLDCKTLHILWTQAM